MFTKEYLELRLGATGTGLDGIAGVETEIVAPHFGITVFITAPEVSLEGLTIIGGALYGIGITGFGAGLGHHQLHRGGKCLLKTGSFPRASEVGRYRFQREQRLRSLCFSLLYRVFLSWVEQVFSGSFSRNNIGNDSFLETNRSGLVTLGGTRIHHSSYADLHNVDFGSSDVSLDRFSTATLQDTTLRLLSCSQGADAHCSEFDGSLEAYATSSCGQCPDRCGNGNKDAGEECDDNNLNGGDGCAPSCTFEICGNFIFDTGEECDDGNLDDGDGCSSICEVEP